MARAELLAQLQHSGLGAERTATRNKQALRTKLRRVLLAHVVRVAEAAAVEQPNVEVKFRLSPENNSFESFRAAAHVVATEAYAEKELLLRHGLSEAVLASLSQALDELDGAMQQGADGRRAHTGASADLGPVIADVMRMVRVLDGLNRHRFGNDAEQLGAWITASNVVGPFQRAEATPLAPEPPGGGDVEVKPAA